MPHVVVLFCFAQHVSLRLYFHFEVTASIWSLLARLGNVAWINIRTPKQLCKVLSATESQMRNMFN